EVVVPRLRTVPEVPPSLRPIAAAMPVLRRGEVSHHGLEPDVDALRFIAGDGDLDAPVQVPRDRSVLQPLPEPAAHEREDVVPPVLLVIIRPCRQRLLEGAEPEEEVLRLLRDGGRAVNPASRLLPCERLEDTPAALATAPWG